MMSIGPRWSMTLLVAVALSILSIVSAAPASAAVRHDDAAGTHEDSAAAAGAGSGRAKVAADPAVPEARAAGHDKCKRPKGNRLLLPWCQDPAGGFIGSSTLRVASPPAGPTSLCDPTSAQPLTRCVPVPPVRPDR
jgi:hypothetical protein